MKGKVQIMARQKLLWLALLPLMLALAACSGNKPESTSEQPAATSAPAASQGKPVDEATVGEITGTVKFEGTKPARHVIKMDQDPVCVKAHGGKPVYFEDGEVNSNDTVPNVFVYVKEGADQYNWPVPSDPVVLDQKGCMYIPHVMGAMVGQDFKVVSSDPTTHNIHPMPKDNREWNESQPPGAAPIVKTWARPEVMIPVKCNQHPWMRCYIGVVKNPLYAVTGEDGTFTIKGVPPGDYTVGFWTATFGEQEQKVTVPAKGTAKVTVTFKPS
jgi:carboxypeptidase family protein